MRTQKTISVRQKPHTAIESLSPEYVKAVVDETGVFHNFVESAQGTFRGLPDLETDPAARQTMKRLDEAVAKLGKQATKKKKDKY